MSDPRNSGRYLVPALIACAVATGPHAAELTIDRLFDAPALAGPTIVGLKISPDGSRVTYLQGKSEDKIAWISGSTTSERAARACCSTPKCWPRPRRSSPMRN